MQRGILYLTKNEAQVSYHLLKSSTQDVSGFTQRLELVINGSEELSTVEVSREDVETLLDVLPIPNQSEDPIYKVLRNKLSMFLAKKNG
ncbi:MAG: hypothetical protein GW941_01525 [Candidatus Pacebacteria bacterium]|nr:hypothetical protein [Candidatus Paceibacterota bacterium]